MNIILKHTLKNIFGKPFRSLVLVVCVTVTCITAYLTLDMTGSIEDIFTAYVADMLGSLDLQISSSREIDTKVLAELPENIALGLKRTSYPVATRDPEQYSYEYVQDLSIYGIKTQPAYQMGLFDEELSLADDETAVSVTYAQTFGYAEGDAVNLYDEYGEKHEFRVKKVLPESGAFIQEHQYTAVVNEEAFKLLSPKGSSGYRDYMVDIVNDKELDAACDLLKEQYPELDVNRLKGNESMREGISQMVAIFGVLFVVTFLMVIFVTVSLSEKIVNERMAVIGTLLSLGVSRNVTTMVLLLENVFYGLFGFLLATPIYNALRDPLYSSMIMTTQGTFRVQPMQGWIYGVVLLGAILVECFTPAKELRKAVKISIRDIIFSNKDTNYVFSRKKTIVGLGLCAVSIVFAFTDVLVLLLLSLILLVVGVAMALPMGIRFLSGGMVRLFGKANWSVAELASIETGSKKNTISNSVLCLTISALTITLFAVGNGLMDICDSESYHADVMAFGAADDRTHYSYIKGLDGVKEVYFMGGKLDYLVVNGEKSSNGIDIMELPQSDMFAGIPDLPEHLEKNEIIFSKAFAQKQKIRVGDEVEVVFKPDGLFPITKTLRVERLADTALYESIPVVILSPELTRDIFHESFGGILVSCDNPDETLDVIKKHSLDQTITFYTAEEYAAEQESQKSGIQAAIILVTVFGVLLSIIGLSGNQVIGFEARRREYAMMYSTSMNRKQLKRLIFLETLFSMGLSVILGCALGLVLKSIVKKTAYALTLPLGIDLGVGQFVAILLVLTLVLVFTSLKPVRLLGKMKIAEELKYE